MKTKCVVLCIGLLLSPQLAHSRQVRNEFSPTGLVMTVSLAKDTYVLGEPIVANVCIANKGRQNITDRWFSCTSGFSVSMIHTETGQDVPLVVAHSTEEPMITDWVDPLTPGESVFTTFDLTRGDILDSSTYFPRIAKTAPPYYDRIARYVFPIVPDKYEIVVAQALDMNRAKDRPRDVLEVSKSFKIRAPNAREKEALALFEKCPAPDGPDYQQSILNAIDAYDTLCQKYGDTVYAPYALYYSARLKAQIENTKGALSDYAELIEKYPGFPLMADVHYYRTLAMQKSGRIDDAKQSSAVLEGGFKNYLVSPDMPMKEKGSRIKQLLATIKGA